ncbi:hypothetical protein EVAR_86602_1 [Eumeta japonica]|uniref:Uncharacterized protein n=1 Tax=Eumeta variegata TaxID=151549 RepID=A0A4C1W3Y6_EUMVA|nr:hypothetical protein EVAR_86602_1 [Eumeta japonica]
MHYYIRLSTPAPPHGVWRRGRRGQELNAVGENLFRPLRVPSSAGGRPRPDAPAIWRRRFELVAAGRDYHDRE